MKRIVAIAGLLISFTSMAVADGGGAVGVSHVAGIGQKEFFPRHRTHCRDHSLVLNSALDDLLADHLLLRSYFTNLIHVDILSQHGP